MNNNAYVWREKMAEFRKNQIEISKDSEVYLYLYLFIRYCIILLEKEKGQCFAKIFSSKNYKN